MTKIDEFPYWDAIDFGRKGGPRQVPRQILVVSSVLSV